MPRKQGHLLRILGVAFGWAVTVGNTIGAGILRAPGEVAALAPSYPAFFALWLAGAAFALLGALTLAELGAMIPQSGGQTVFVKRAFGAYPGFAVAWSDWLSTCAAMAVITIVLVDAAVVIVPSLLPAKSMMSAGVILGIAAIQWRGIRSGSVTQLVTSVLKTAGFGALVVACFIAGPAEAAAPAATIATQDAVTLVGIVIAFQIMIYTYDGWTGVLYFSGEVDRPGRDIPRSMMSGVISVAVIYLLINLAFVRVLPLNRMAGDPMVGDTISQIVFGPAGTVMMRVLIVISVLGALNAVLLIASRIGYAAGLSRVNEGGTPTSSLALSTLVSVGFVLSGTFNQVAAVAAFFFVANYAASFSSVFRLRTTEPDTPRPYRAWGFPIVTAIVLAISLAFLAAVVLADTRTSLYAILLLAVSYPLHRFLRRIPDLTTE